MPVLVLVPGFGVAVGTVPVPLFVGDVILPVDEDVGDVDGVTFLPQPVASVSNMAATTIRANTFLNIQLTSSVYLCGSIPLSMIYLYHNVHNFAILFIFYT
jgi:hypothetical protein